jgi:hypothetical protein
VESTGCTTCTSRDTALVASLEAWLLIRRSICIHICQADIHREDLEVVEVVEVEVEVEVVDVQSQNETLNYVIKVACSR